VDDAPIDGADLLDREAELVHHAGAVVLDEHVGAAEQPAERLLALSRLEIERDAALAVVVGDEVRAIGAAAGGAERIAAVGMLDLDHRGAELAEQHARIGRGDHGAELDDGHSVEWSRRRLGHRSLSRTLIGLLEHDLFRKPGSTFRDHALAVHFVAPRCAEESVGSADEGCQHTDLIRACGGSRPRPCRHSFMMACCSLW
jgi:hypothetical protein